MVTLAIHNEQGNPHAHFQISRRSINEKGEWSWTKDREIASKVSLRETRKLWAEKVNLFLEREGFVQRVDHRSFADLGLSFEPTRHEGWFAHKLERLGVPSRIIAENEEIKQRNKERAAFEPEAILTELCTKQATFSALDLARIVQMRLGDDVKLASMVYENSLQKAIVVGSNLDGQIRYSSSDYIAKETEALQWVQDFNQKTSAMPIDSYLKENILNEQYAYLNSEQRQAVENLCSDKSLGVLIGRAGTGKTTTLKPVVDIYTQSNYKVIGLSLSAAAADNLKLEANCESETIAFYLDKWERLEAMQQRYWSIHPTHEHPGIVRELNKLMDYGLTKQHLVIVDEAGMVGTAQWHRLLHHIQKAGAKPIAAGDDHQFKAMDAGDFFRKFTETAKAHNTLSTLSNIMRQQEPWMQEASVLFAELKTYEALARYENHGLVQKIAPGVEGIQLIAKHYMDKLLDNPEKTGLLLASTNVQCEALNREVRHLLKEQDLLAKEEFSIQGRGFAVNDKIIFLNNDRAKNIAIMDANGHLKNDFMVKNGTKGQIVAMVKNESLNAYQVTVTIDENTYATFNTEHYSAFNHAYASTLLKAQGQTVDWSYVLASKHMDAYAIYVALTRHREETKLFYDEKTFADFKSLQSFLGRVNAKDLVVDYTISAENLNAWENVQDYKLLGQDFAATIKEQDWEGYQALKAERIALGKIILSEWEEHQPFLRQAGITQESMEIACGQKIRPLSLAEIEAKTNVGLYAEKSLQARLVWRDIRQTHPGKNCYQHARYAEFTVLRQERNALAALMVSQKPRYQEWIKELGKVQGISWKTLVAQSTQGTEFKIEKSAYTKNTSIENDKGHSVAPSPYRTPFVRVEPQQIKDELQHKIGILAHTLLGEPQQKNAREWRYGNKGSTAICVAGTKQGLYANFETSSYGGPLQLIQDSLKIDHKEAYKWAIDWLGHSLSQREQRVDFRSEIPSKQKNVERQWIPIFPVPTDKQNPDIKKDNNLSYQLTQKGRFEVERYPYKDAGDHLLGYTVRLKNKKGDKVVLPLTYCREQQGAQEWRWQGFGSERPLYGLDRLAKHPLKPVLVVEGEKTANHAQVLFPDSIVVSWPGGTGAVNQVDWSPLMGKNITLWPDNDEAGVKAMDKIEAHLITLHEAKTTEVQIQKVVLPAEIPHKWDLADPLPPGWTFEALQALLPKASGLVQAKPAINQEKIVDILRSEGMRYLYEESPKNVMERANDLYGESLNLHQLLKINLTDQEKIWIEKKSIVAGALQARIQERFYSEESYWRCATQSNTIALIAAEIKLLDPHSIRNEAQLIVRAHRIFGENQEKFEQHFLSKFKDMAQENTIKLLSQEQLHCHYQTHKTFSHQECLSILKNIKEIQNHKLTVVDDGIMGAHKLEISSVVHETLKSHRQMETASIQQLFNQTTSRMVAQQNIAIEKSKESSKTKDIQLEQDKEISL